MSERPETQLASPDCPRCGYDLRATVSTWTDRCPLDGRCSECGLEFTWTEVFDPLSRVPSWSLEFAPLFRLPDALLRTLLALLAPWWFWRRLRLSMPIHWGRLALLPVLVLVVIPWLVLMVGQAQLAIEEALHRSRFMGVTDEVGVSRAVAWAILFPLSDDPVPGSRYYSSPWTSLFDSRSYWDRQPVGPTVLHRMSAVRRWGLPRQWGAVCWFGPIQAAGGLLTIAGLPQTRRRARVRLRHLGRIAAYSTPILALIVAVPVVFSFTLPSSFATFSGSTWSAEACRWLVFLGVPTLALGAWWSSITRRHLQLPHATGVALAALVLGTLLATFSLIMPIARLSLWWE